MYGATNAVATRCRLTDGTTGNVSLVNVHGRFLTPVHAPRQVAASSRSARPSSLQNDGQRYHGRRAETHALQIRFLILNLTNNE